jgi:PhzF family phenazine biosynthesis protein
MNYYHVDSFTRTLFKGNPAGVCILEEAWPTDAILQDIAMENYLSETAFVLKNDSGYHIRWFAPKSEIYLCGHATLAAAFVLFNYEGEESDLIDFDAHLGRLSVRKDGDLLTLIFRFVN